MYCAMSFTWLEFDFHTLLPPFFEDAVQTRVSVEFFKAVEEFARTTGAGWAGVGALRRDSRGGTGTTVGALHMPPQALVVYTPVAVFGNVLLTALNGLRLFAPVSLLYDLGSALDGSLAKAAGTLLGAPREEAQGAAKAFVRLLVLFVRRGLIEGVYTVCSSW